MNTKLYLSLAICLMSLVSISSKVVEPVNGETISEGLHLLFYDDFEYCSINEMIQAGWNVSGDTAGIYTGDSIVGISGTNGPTIKKMFNLPTKFVMEVKAWSPSNSRISFGLKLDGVEDIVWIDDNPNEGWLYLGIGGKWPGKEVYSGHSKLTDLREFQVYKIKVHEGAIEVYKNDVLIGKAYLSTWANGGKFISTSPTFWNTRQEFDYLKVYSEQCSETVTTLPTDNPPFIRITNPSDGDRFGTGDSCLNIPVEVDVNDDKGIEKVEFYLDGNLADTVSDEHYTGGISICEDGYHTITAKAYDTSWQTASDSVGVYAETCCLKIVDVKLVKDGTEVDEVQVGDEFNILVDVKNICSEKVISPISYHYEVYPTDKDKINSTLPCPCLWNLWEYPPYLMPNEVATLSPGCCVNFTALKSGIVTMKVKVGCDSKTVQFSIWGKQKPNIKITDLEAGNVYEWKESYVTVDTKNYGTSGFDFTVIARIWGPLEDLDKGLAIEPRMESKDVYLNPGQEESISFHWTLLPRGTYKVNVTLEHLEPLPGGGFKPVILDTKEITVKMGYEDEYVKIRGTILNISRHCSEPYCGADIIVEVDKVLSDPEGKLSVGDKVWIDACCIRHDNCDVDWPLKEGYKIEAKAWDYRYKDSPLGLPEGVDLGMWIYPKDNPYDGYLKIISRETKSKLTVKVHNIPGANLPANSGEITVYLYTAEREFISKKKETYSGGEDYLIFEFEGIKEGDYMIDVYNEPAGENIVEHLEFWGSSEVKVSDSSTVFDFYRHAPYIMSLTPRDIELELGESITPKVSIKNPEDSPKHVKIRVIIDRDGVPPYDYDYTKENLVARNGAVTEFFPKYVLPAGDNYIYAIVYTDYQPYYTTDQWIWSKIKVSASITVYVEFNDADGDRPLKNARVTLFDSKGNEVGVCYTDADGICVFKNVNPKEKYEAECCLTDGKYIRVLDASNGNKLVCLKEGMLGDKRDILIYFGENHEDDAAHIFYNLEKAVEFYKETLGYELSYNVPENVYIFSSRDTSHLINTKDSKCAIYINEEDSDKFDMDSPMNLEWHELNHHLMYDFMKGYVPPKHWGDTNHGGFNNHCTSDSWIEGFAIFMSCVIKAEKGEKNPHIYVWDYFNPSEPSIGTNLEKAQNPIKEEEFAVAGVLWDLYDGIDTRDDTPNIDDDKVDLTIQEIWNVISEEHKFPIYYGGDKEERYISYVSDLYQAFSKYDVNHDGKVDRTDEALVKDIFETHGFPIRDGHIQFEDDPLTKTNEATRR